MKKWEQTLKIACINCKHRWTLRSTDFISAKDYILWVNSVGEEHLNIHKQKEAE